MSNVYMLRHMVSSRHCSKHHPTVEMFKPTLLHRATTASVFLILGLYVTYHSFSRVTQLCLYLLCVSNTSDFPLVQVSADVGAFAETIRAYHRLMELREKYVDVEVLRVLVTAVNENLPDIKGQPGMRLLESSSSIACTY